MQNENHNILLEDSVHKHHARSPIAKAVREATEVGIVVPSILKKNLQDAEYQIIDDPKIQNEQYGYSEPKFLKRVLVVDKDGNLVAMGASENEKDALLHALLGWFRENPTPERLEKMREGIGVGLGVVANSKG